MNQRWYQYVPVAFIHRQHLSRAPQHPKGRRRLADLCQEAAICKMDLGELMPVSFEVIFFILVWPNGGSPSVNN